ncbi:MAG: citrate/2-methylcitrate synthase [Clostridia bacterium]|nr:citrate/2-methylcitrate synthase [Clostridia bacterium]
MSTIESRIEREYIEKLCDQIRKYNYIEPSDFDRFNIKRGLRNSDGTGVMAGITSVCSVEGYFIDDGEKVPREGHLYFRGINMEDIVNACITEDRFGFEEVVYLLLFGTLPTKEQLDNFCNTLSVCRELPDDFIEDMIMKAPSPDIMNKLSRSVLALYSYDNNPDDTSVENILRQCVHLIAQIPAIMVYAYQVKRRHYYKKSMYIHQMKPEHRTAETILRSIRADKTFTDKEAKLLDICLMLHAEHGGGNNSTFTTRVLSSSGTDTYASMAASIGSLKGPKHGGANIKVSQMVDHFKENITDITNEGQVADFINKIIKKEAGDGSGLIYGMGHAIYTLSDPRAKILRQKAEEFSVNTEFEDEFRLLSLIEQLTPEIFNAHKGTNKAMCANVDLYSGLVYKMLDIPPDLFTPIFTIARIAGWSAHRIEESLTGGKIIRPAYKSNITRIPYTNINNR